MQAKKVYREINTLKKYQDEGHSRYRTMSIKYECDNVISEREKNNILKYSKIKREEHTIKM